MDEEVIVPAPDTRKGEPLYEDVKQKLRFSPVVYADETHWRENGRNSFVWNGGNENLALFHIDANRSGLVAQHLFGEQFDGSLVTDGYAAHNAVNASSSQACLAHLTWKANEVAHGIGLLPRKHRDQEALRFCQSIAHVLRDACELGRKRHPRSCSIRRNARLVSHFYFLVDTICSTPLVYEPADTATAQAALYNDSS